MRWPLAFHSNTHLHSPCRSFNRGTETSTGHSAHSNVRRRSDVQAVCFGFIEDSSRVSPLRSIRSFSMHTCTVTVLCLFFSYFRLSLLSRCPSLIYYLLSVLSPLISVSSQLRFRHIQLIYKQLRQLIERASIVKLSFKFFLCVVSSFSSSSSAFAVCISCAFCYSIIMSKSEGTPIVT